MSISYRDHALLLTNILKKKITYHYFHTYGAECVLKREREASVTFIAIKINYI